MKAILEFELPEDKENFNVASKGMDWAIVAWELNQLLRNMMKYGHEYKDTDTALQYVKDALNEMLVDRGLQYPA
tara:strand:- start:16042 stop:16263 length:222 start_codon:yes stop_codon:yes gene_type:complete